MKHQYVVTYTKRTNLLDYMRGNYDDCADKHFHREEAMRNYYAKERNVRLVLLVRHEDGKCFCTIKCPINPLPVKGEFEVPSINVLHRFLVANGWVKSEAFSAKLFE